jgi:capsular exopolysaccharide synthesis family protein
MGDETLEKHSVHDKSRINLSGEAYGPRSRYPQKFGHAEAHLYNNGYYGYGDHIGGHEVRKLWDSVRNHKLLIALIVVVVTAIVTVAVFQIEPWFEASTIIDVGTDAKVVKSGDLLLNDDSISYDAIDLNTKSLMFTSAELGQDVVVKMKLDQNPWFLDTTTNVKPSWTVRGLLKALIKPFRSDKREQLGKVFVDESATRPSGEPVRSAEEVARLAPFVSMIRGNVSVEQIRGTRAVLVTYRHANNVIAAAVANGIAQTFIERNFHSQTANFTNSSEWLDRSTRELKGKVEQAEQALANYTRDHNIFTLTENSKDTLTTEKLTRLHDQAIRAETDRLLKQSLYEQVKAGRITEMPDAFSDPKITELQKQLNSTMTTIQELEVKYGPQNPQVLAAQQRMEAIKEQLNTSLNALRDKLNADYERALKDETSIKGALQRAKSEAVDENQAAIQYSILKQDAQTTRALYNDFLQKSNQTKALIAEQNSNIRVIQRADIPSDTAGPRRGVFILLSFFVSLLGGIAIAFLIDHFDNHIKDHEDLDRFVQLPALGMVPEMANFKMIYGKPQPYVSIGLAGESGSGISKLTKLKALDYSPSTAEAYRAFRTSMLLSATGPSPKTILFTSSKPGEGKTTTAVNTAVSIAQLKANVLLIDCDLRRPSVSTVLGLEESSGLTTYLSGEIELENVIQKLPIPNLSVIPSGSIPQDPTELISSKKMKAMLQTLSDRYDYIVIDSPPVINVTDPVILSTLVDGVVLVVHAGRTSREAVQRSRQELLSVGADLLGVVLNNAKLNGSNRHN